MRTQKSRALDRDGDGRLARRRQRAQAKNRADETLPPFVVREEFTAAIQPGDSTGKSTPNISRVRIFFGKIFQSAAYFCLFIGFIAVLGCVAAAAVKYWPQNTTGPSGGADISSGYYGGGLWWLAINSFAPQFVVVTQIIIGVLALLLFIWGWRTAVRAARRFVWRIADELMKPLALVEPLLLLGCYCLAIVGLWWLAEAELFLALVVVLIGLLMVGLICFAVMRKLAGSRLDLSRAEIMRR